MGLPAWPPTRGCAARQASSRPEYLHQAGRRRRLIALSVPFLPDNSDLIACTVITKDGGMLQRFLAVDIYQMSLVEPDVSRLGWGVVKFAGLLQVRWPKTPGTLLLGWLYKHPRMYHLYSQSLVTQTLHGPIIIEKS